MSTTPTSPAQTAPDTTADSSVWRWLRQRSELGFAAGVLLIAVFITVQTLTMTVPDSVSSPGPKFFPTLVAIFLYLTGGLLAVNVILNPRHTPTTTTMSQFSADMLGDLGGLDDPDEVSVLRRTGSSERQTEIGTAAAESDEAPPVPAGSGYVPVDYRTVGIVLAGLVGFILLLNPVGWLLTSAGLFWVLCYALGSRRPVFDIGVSLAAASIIQLAFSAGLGLTLPSGILEGVLQWTS